MPDDDAKKTRAEQCQHAMLMMLGANEAIKQTAEPSLATTVYYRLLREEARRQFLALGGKIDYEAPREVLTLPTRPEMTFYTSDIEAMRALVAEHDARVAERK